MTILLTGELGAGKTAFAQGFAKELGITEAVTSPTFALEQRYGDVFAHLDLYRLKPAHAREFLVASDDFPGIRLIEWADRAKPKLKGDIEIWIEPKRNGTRQVTINFRDISIPSGATIQKLLKHACLPAHIVHHAKAVAGVCAICAKNLLRRGIVVRAQALQAAARLHDVVRFLDFPSWEGDEYYVPTDLDRKTWQAIKDRYPRLKHEQAGAQVLVDAGYPAIGQMIATHKGHSHDPSKLPNTTEQKLLAYADKRVRLTHVVSLRERFDDLAARNSHKKFGRFEETWRNVIGIEKELFPEGAPV